jgi:hypothetical protein
MGIYLGRHFFLLMFSVGSILASIFSMAAIRYYIICSIFVLWWYNDQDPMQFPIQPLLTLIFTCMSDYRRGLDWWLDLVTTYRSKLQLTIALSLIHTLYNSLEHALSVLSLLCLHQSLSGNSFQHRCYLRFCVHAITGRWLSPNQLNASFHSTELTPLTACL